MVEGPPIFQPINEFITAIRQGNPSNDDRNLASFATYEDGRAGIGLLRGNIREDFDKRADSDGNFALRFNQLVKPPLMTGTELVGATSSLSDIGVLDELDVDGTTRLYLAFGDQLWYSNGSTTALTRTTADPFASGEIQAFEVYTAPTSGAKFGFLATAGAGEIVYFNDPTAVSPFTAVTGINAESLFQYDGKLWVMGPGTLEWSIDPTVAANWTVAAPTGAWPNRWRFLGVFPFGETYLPYVIINHDDPNSASLAVIDMSANQLFPLSLGLTRITDAFPASGGLIVVHASGREVTAFDPAELSRIPLDWRAQDRGGFLAERDGLAISGVGHPRGPVIVSNFSASTHAQLFLHKTTGWHPYGRKVVGSGIRAVHYSTNLNKILFPVQVSGDDLVLYEIPWFDEAYRPLADQSFLVETEDMADITPWFTLGYANLAGPLLMLQCGGDFDEDNQVKVEYQLDFDESGDWELLGTFPNTNLPGEVEITGRSEAVEQRDTLLFNELAGVPFTAVRFRWTLISSNPNQSPNAYPMVARFLKRPNLRQSIRWNIDVAATIGDRGGHVTPDDIWKELKAVYDLKVVPEITIGPYHTWAVMIGMPFIIESSGVRDDMVESVVSDTATIVINIAELL